MKTTRYPSLLSSLTGLLLLQAAPAIAGNINVVWTSEVGQFAPLVGVFGKQLTGEKTMEQLDAEIGPLL